MNGISIMSRLAYRVSLPTATPNNTRITRVSNFPIVLSHPFALGSMAAAASPQCLQRMSLSVAAAASSRTGVYFPPSFLKCDRKIFISRGVSVGNRIVYRNARLSLEAKIV